MLVIETLNSHAEDDGDVIIYAVVLQVMISPDADPPVCRIMDYRWALHLSGSSPFYFNFLRDFVRLILIGALITPHSVVPSKYRYELQKKKREAQKKAAGNYFYFLLMSLVLARFQMVKPNSITVNTCDTIISILGNSRLLDPYRCTVVME